MNDDDKFTDWMRREAADYHRLPEPTPDARDAMWARIEGSVAETVSAYGSSTVGPRPAAERSRRAEGRGPRAFAWPVAAAAMLVLGVGIGRLTASRTGETVPFGPGRPTTVALARDTVHAAPAAVVDHLAQSVVFLASFREDARTGRVDAAVQAQGRDLLSTTQILMDAPAAQDPRLHALLEDLELVLAQIAQLDRRRGAEEARIASDAMKQRDILPRLRTVVPQEALDATMGAADAGN